MMIRTLLACLLVIILVAPSPAGEVTLWEEIPGDLITDLSDDFANPTSVGTLGLGTSQVFGFVENLDRSDRDIFTFRVDAGQQLDSIKVQVGGNRHYLALEAGTQISNPNSSNALLLGRLISESHANDNLLTVEPVLESFEVFRVSAPLGPGDYTFWIQETALQNFDYEVAFQTSVTAIPEPSGCLFLSLVATGICVCRRTRRTSFAT